MGPDRHLDPLSGGGVRRERVERIAHVPPGHLDAEPEHLLDEALPAVEVVVEAAGPDPGLGGDVAEAGAVSLEAEHPGRGVEDPLSGPLRLGEGLDGHHSLHHLPGLHQNSNSD